MQTLWRYLGMRFTSSFLGSLGILTLVVLVVDMLLNMDEILEVQQSPMGVVGFLSIRTAALYLPYLVPAAAFTGVFLSLGLAARASEVIAMKAGGVSPLGAIVPVFLLAGFISLLALVVSETITVRASASLNEQLGRGVGDVSVRSGSIWYNAGRFIYNIRDPDPESETVGDIRVYERDESGRLIRMIHAGSATRVAPQLWNFRNATVRTFDIENPSNVPKLERAEEMEIELAQDQSLQKLATELPGLSLGNIWAYVGSVLEAGGDPRRARAHLHERLTRPLLVALFVLLATPLALKVEQTRSLALPVLQGVILLFLFLLLRENAANLAPRGSAVAVMPWAAIGLFSGYGAWQLFRVPQ